MTLFDPCSNCPNRKPSFFDQIMIVADSTLNIDEIKLQPGKVEYTEPNKYLTKLAEIRRELDGIFRYYRDSYSNFEFDVDDAGKPIDPEYYIFETLKKVEKMLDKEI